MGNKKKRIKVESTSEESDSDEDLSSISSDEDNRKVITVEDFRKEMLDKYEEEKKDADCFEAKDKVTVGNYVLVAFETKTKKVHFVGQVAKISDVGDPEVIFLRCKNKTKHSTTFSWPESRDETEVPSSDVIAVLPEPTLGRRGDLTFGVIFDSYNIQ